MDRHYLNPRMNEPSQVPNSMPNVSAFIVCCNEEKHIRNCLESVKWCGEIVIVDSGSTDRTLEICREYTDKIFHQDWLGFVAQKGFGLRCCTREWVLNIDADEEVSPQLGEEIRRLLSDPKTNEVCGYKLSRVVYYLGRWWRSGGWYPEYRLRLCKRDRTTWGGTDPHEKAIVSGPVRLLKGELFHYTYSDFFDQIRTLNSHSSVAAGSLFKAGARTRVLDLLTRPTGRFIKFYLLKGGFKEGFAGLAVALIEAYYVLLKYVKLWELQRSGQWQPADRSSLR